MKTKLLIGEDEPSLVEILQYVVKKLDLEYEVHVNGVDVLDKAREWLPDILLLDVYMPKMTGIDVCTALKSDPATKDIFIIIITASIKDEDERNAWAAGADEFMTKPFSPGELLKRLTHILDERKNQIDDLKNQAI